MGRSENVDSLFWFYERILWHRNVCSLSSVRSKSPIDSIRRLSWGAILRANPVSRGALIRQDQFGAKGHDKHSFG